MRKWIAVLCALLALGTVAVAFAEEAAAPPAAPPWKSAELSEPETGKTHNLGALTAKGKTMLVFSQTACSACRGELSFLQELRQKNPNFNIVVVNVDIKPSKELFAGYKGAYGFGDMLFLSDPTFKVPQMFGFGFTPASALIADGKVVESFRGFRAEEKPKIEEALKK